MFALPLLVHPPQSDVDRALSLAVAPDGGYAVGFSSGIVRVFDGHDHLRDEFIERGTVCSLAFSPDSRTLATGFQDDGRNVSTGLWTVDGRLLRYFDAEQRKPPSPKDPMAGFSYVTTYSLSWSADGKLLAAAHGGHLNAGVVLWEVNGSCAGHLQPVFGGVDSVRFSPDGQSIATATDDGFVSLWSRNGSLVWRRQLSERDSVADAEFPRTGATIVWATSWQDRWVGSLDAKTGKLLWRRRVDTIPSQVLPYRTGAVVALEGRLTFVGPAGVRSVGAPSASGVRFAIDPNRGQILSLSRSGAVQRIPLRFPVGGR